MIIDAILIAIFALPVLTGLLIGPGRLRVRRMVFSAVTGVQLLICTLLAVFAGRWLFSASGRALADDLTARLPQNITGALNGYNGLIFMAAVPITLVSFYLAARFLTNKFAELTFGSYENLSDNFYLKLRKLPAVIRHAATALLKVPGALFNVFAFAFALYLFTLSFNVPAVSSGAAGSALYKKVYEYAISPLVNSRTGKTLPVLVADYFRLDTASLPDPGSGTGGSGGTLTAQELAEKLTGGRLKIIERYNGVTLDEALRSNDAIDSRARAVAAPYQSTEAKAYAIYVWIRDWLDYDSYKAEMITSDPGAFRSGSIAAYELKKGICFDYACLFVSMCRANGIKTRIVTGLAFGGSSWGDHAWNQVYIPESGGWLNVDVTFGEAGDYFGTKNFYDDHIYPDIAGEW